ISARSTRWESNPPCADILGNKQVTRSFRRFDNCQNVQVTAGGIEAPLHFLPSAISVFSSNSAVARVTRGKELSIVDWDHFTKFQEYLEKIFAAPPPESDK